MRSSLPGRARRQRCRAGDESRRIRGRVRDAAGAPRRVHPRVPPVRSRRRRRRRRAAARVGRARAASRTASGSAISGTIPRSSPLEKCRYDVGLEVPGDTMADDTVRRRVRRCLVAEVEIDGTIEVELRALQWLYGTWLPQSGYVPASSARIRGLERPAFRPRHGVLQPARAAPESSQPSLSPRFARSSVEPLA